MHNNAYNHVVGEWAALKWDESGDARPITILVNLTEDFGYNQTRHVDSHRVYVLGVFIAQ